MAGPDPDSQGDPLLRTVRVVSAAVVLCLLVFLVVVDTVGKIIFGPSFGVSDVIFASLLGALGFLLGIEGVGAIRRRG